MDGLTAAAHPVIVTPDGLGLGLRITRVETGAALVWPLSGLRIVDGPKAQLVLTFVDHGDEEERLRDEARLTLLDPQMIAWVRSHAPDLGKRDLRAGTLRKVALWVGGAIAALALILFVLIPALSDMLADTLSPETEAAFGDAVAGQMRTMLGGKGADLTCSAAPGLAALEKLRRALTGGQDLDYDIRLSVLDHEMVNAFALPGGQIVVLRGLLDQAETPGELAGVLGHEIGHVEARDPTRVALRTAGSAGILSMVFGDVTGGLVLGLVSTQILSASYTREAEARADRFAWALMDRTGIGTEGLAVFFDRLARDTKDLPEYLSTHPASENRAAAARRADAGTRTPVLTEAEWRDLKAICRD